MDAIATTNAREIKLAPSDFAFLWEDCPRCFHRKAAQGHTPPRGGFPGIFSKIDSMAKGMFRTRESLERLGITGFTPVVFPGRFRSEVFAHGQSKLDWSVNCQMDALWRHDDGWYCVPDLKTTEAKDDKLPLYTRQLHAYALALGNPADAAKFAKVMGVGRLEVREVGLLCWCPDAMTTGSAVQGSSEIGDRMTRLSGAWVWKPLEYDPVGFLEFIDRVLMLCAADEPPAAEKCGLCNYVDGILATSLEKRVEAELAKRLAVAA